MTRMGGGGGVRAFCSSLVRRVLLRLSFEAVVVIVPTSVPVSALIPVGGGGGGCRTAGLVSTVSTDPRLIFVDFLKLALLPSSLPSAMLFFAVLLAEGGGGGGTRWTTG